MNRGNILRLAALPCLATVALALVTVPGVYALGVENVKCWEWISGAECYATAVGEVDGDGDAEIVTGGAYWDFGLGIAQLAVWDGATLALENVKTWYWVSDTSIRSVTIGDVDGDDDAEIVTGGFYNDGTRENAQLCVWDGATLELEDVTTWYWGADTYIWSVAVGDVDADGAVEIVTGGMYNDGIYAAQLVVWDGATLTLEDVTTWYWELGTIMYSVAVGDVDGDGDVEIATGGYYYDGTRSVAQLVVWSGATLTLENVKTWYWVSDTIIRSVALGDVDADGAVEIVTGGYYYDGTRHVAQLVAWDGATLELEDVTAWYWIQYTYIYSVVVGDVDGDGSAEVVTGGYYYDGIRNIAQLVVWGGSTLALEDVTAWYWVQNTYIWSVATGDVDSDVDAEIVTGGSYWDDGYIAQLVVWSIV